MIDGQTGHIIAPFDTGRLCDACAVLVEDADRRRRMGQRLASLPCAV